MSAAPVTDAPVTGCTKACSEAHTYESGCALHGAPYDSTAATLRHSLRVGALLAPVVAELAQRAVSHDLSKTVEPERSAFDRYTPQLRDCTYGSEQYDAALTALAPALEHHYDANRHHPQHHPDGVDSMTLVDLLEMLADWKASGERHADGSMSRSLAVSVPRFGIDPQLARILANTAVALGWLSACVLKGCDADEIGTAHGGAPMRCGGYGANNPGCMANWLSADPEDLEPYGEYLREQAARHPRAVADWKFLP